MMLRATKDGCSTITTFQSNGTEMVDMTATQTDGTVAIYNKTGEDKIQIGLDEYGDGVVWAFNRVGKGHMLHPEP